MKCLLLAFALVLPTAALAEPIETQKIITAAAGDWNGDGAIDLAMIVETEPGAAMDMHFFLRDKEHNFLKPAGIVQEQMYGEWNGYDRPGYEASYIEPELTALPNGSIKLYIPGIPSNGARTDQTLTLAWRNDAFVVAGFAYDYHDYMKDNVASDCDYNLLTGKGKSSKMQPDGTRLHRTVTVEGKVVPFAEWDSGASFTDCGE
ncbi:MULTISPECIES: hypothetical protein [Mesorhizobium]|uniref:hypothetical protein n=1 Tax=Mesorhizobium TaxID=68287 RepID=UPI0003CEFED0|nr:MULTISPECIES: hypothetical protein [Mesorhizobium]ESY65480.1 hypothetical protein X742_22535 [Mesorhizobium sp. LNHC232B00]WJI41613.1 hypothetical protein NL534_15755 [Mesorhizobium opportunistum]